jgi:hypothetical protein
MPFTTVCPSCDSRLTAPNTILGKKVKCKKCDEPFVAKRVAEPDDDDRPARPSKAAAAKARSSRPADDDNEPGLKSRKKGKKTKQGSPALLFVLVGVGALVLIGGAIGAYVYFSDPKTPDKSNGGDNGSSTGATAGNPPRDLVAGWPETHEPEGRYRIKFPKAPEKTTDKGPPELGGNVVSYQAQSMSGNYTSTHVAVAEDERKASSDDQIADRFLELWIKGHIRDVEIGERKAISYQSFKGREAAVKMPETQFIFTCRIIVAGERIIALTGQEIVAPSNPSRVSAFFESLKIE